jgi:cytochrome c556
MNRCVLLVSLVGVLCASAARSTPVSPISRHRAVASVQELMQTLIDPAADGVWNAVETTTTRAGETVRQPQTPAQWRDVRLAAMSLVEGANALLAADRPVGLGALDSTQIGARIAARRSAFNAFATALRVAARTSLRAIEARDAPALVTAGGQIDQVCEGCHLAFWYPNQVIPSLPK